MSLDILNGSDRSLVGALRVEREAKVHKKIKTDTKRVLNNHPFGKDINHTLVSSRKVCV